MAESISELIENMDKNQSRLFVKELKAERDLLKAEISKIQRKKSKQEIEFLKSQNIRLQKELSENNEVTQEYIREKIKEILSEKKELSDDKPSSKRPVFYSQPKQEEETEYEELSDLDNLIQIATSAVIRRK